MNGESKTPAQVEILSPDNEGEVPAGTLKVRGRCLGDVDPETMSVVCVLSYPQGERKQESLPCSISRERTWDVTFYNVLPAAKVELTAQRLVPLPGERQQGGPRHTIEFSVCGEQIKSRASA